MSRHAFPASQLVQSQAMSAPLPCVGNYSVLPHAQVLGQVKIYCSIFTVEACAPAPMRYQCLINGVNDEGLHTT